MGVKKGDRVTIYMGRVPEIAIAMLACAKVGAPHSVVYGGFSEQALASRIEDAQSQVLITCDGAWLRGKIVPLKDTVDEAVHALAGGGDCHRSQAHRCTISTWSRGAITGITISWRCPSRGPKPRPKSWTPKIRYLSSIPAARPANPKGVLHTHGGYQVYTVNHAVNGHLT